MFLNQSFSGGSFKFRLCHRNALRGRGFEAGWAVAPVRPRATRQTSCLITGEGGGGRGKTSPSPAQLAGVGPVHPPTISGPLPPFLCLSGSFSIMAYSRDRTARPSLIQTVRGQFGRRWTGPEPVPGRRVVSKTLLRGEGTSW